MREKLFGDPPQPLKKPILTGNLVKSTLQTRVENFRQCRWGAEQRVPRARTRERGPPSALAEIFFFSSFLLFFLPPLLNRHKGVWQDFDFLHGLLTHKNMSILMKKKKFGDPPQPPKKADFGRTKAKMGRFSQNGLCYSFEILQGLLSNKNIRIPI